MPDPDETTHHRKRRETTPGTVAFRSAVTFVALGAVAFAIVLGKSAMSSAETPEAEANALSLAVPVTSAPPSSAPPEQKKDRRVPRMRDKLPKPSTDPRLAIARQVEKASNRLNKERETVATGPVVIKVGSFNVLGDWHTAPGGERPGWPDASWRTPAAAELMRVHGVDVVGTQELKPAQLDGLLRIRDFAAYPGYQFGRQDTDNSILYNPRVFEFVSGSSFQIRFMSRDRPQTVLRLRHIVSGQEMYFINAHPSAGHDRFNTSHRFAGYNRIVAEINALKADGIPIIVTGDMNDRAAFFCRVLPPTQMVASVGGNTEGGCHPPGRMPVDWVVATSEVQFSNYWLDESPIRRRISDHFFISATATVPVD